MMNSINEELLMVVIEKRTEAAASILALLESGADINYQMPAEIATKMIREGTSVLMLAVQENLLDVVKLLVAKGADLSLKDVYKREAIHYAADMKDSSAMETLLAHGADVKAKDYYGNTALHVAANHSVYQYGIIKLLIENGADETMVNDDGLTPVEIEEIKNNHSGMGLLRSRYEEKVLSDVIDQPDNNNATLNF